MRNPIFCALDVSSVEAALDLVSTISPSIGGIKLGLEFFYACGREGVAEIAARSGLPIFLDLKLHDISNTVGGAVRALSSLAPAIMTVHAQGGIAMMQAARAMASPTTKVVAVTVLTSLDEADINTMGVSGGLSEYVRHLAQCARASGLDGLVCAAHEVAWVRAMWPEAYLVVPGIRPKGGDAGDQKRVMAPAEALQAGATILVIGRPITAAPDPAAAAQALAQEIGV